MTISEFISNFGAALDTISSFGGMREFSTIGGDSEDGEHAFLGVLPSSEKFRLTYDWNDLVLLVCFKIGIDDRRVGESDISQLFLQPQIFKSAIQKELKNILNFQSTS